MKIKFKLVGYTIAVILLIGSVLIPIEARTQEKEPEASPEGLMAIMGPMMGDMAENMTEGVLNIMAKPQTAERLATFIKNYYDALIAKGSSKEEALKIVTSVGIPNIPMIQ